MTAGTFIAIASIAAGAAFVWAIADAQSWIDEAYGDEPFIHDEMKVPTTRMTGGERGKQRAAGVTRQDRTHDSGGL